jgi:signal transduction histidine kinase
LRSPIATAGVAMQRLATLEAAVGGTRRRGARDLRDSELLAIARAILAEAEELLADLPGLLAAETAPRLEPVPLGEIARRTRDDLAVELRSSGGIITIAEPLPIALGHPERLRIALRNLLQNAICYRRSDAPLRIHIGASSDREWRELRVADNGAGIARRDRERLFAPLERAAPAARAGSGLGLTIARAAVEACGGTLSLRSRPGRGATFAIRLRAAGTAGSASRS